MLDIDKIQAMDVLYFGIGPIWLVLAVLVHGNATKRRLKDPASGAIMTLLLGVVGALGYYFMIIRPDKHDI